MAAIKTDSNHPVVLSDEDLVRRLDHLDEIVHRVEQQTAGILAFIDEHRPALARGLALMDPGAKLRAAMGRRGRA